MQRLGQQAKQKIFTAMKKPNNQFPLSRSSRSRRKSGKTGGNQAGGADDSRPRFRKPGRREMKSRKSSA
jgi:hypothetical protein